MLKYIIKWIVPSIPVCAILLCFAECLKHGNNAAAIAAAIAALSEAMRVYFSNTIDSISDNIVTASDTDDGE